MSGYNPNIIAVKNALIDDKGLSGNAKAVYCFTLMVIKKSSLRYVWLNLGTIINAMYGKRNISPAERVKFNSAFDELLTEGYISAKEDKQGYLIDTENSIPDMAFTLIDQRDILMIYNINGRNKGNITACYLTAVKSMVFDTNTHAKLYGDATQETLSNKTGYSKIQVKNYMNTLATYGIFYICHSSIRQSNTYGFYKDKDLIVTVAKNRDANFLTRVQRQSGGK